MGWSINPWNTLLIFLLEEMYQSIVFQKLEQTNIVFLFYLTELKISLYMVGQTNLKLKSQV